jgi:hypothetical protein
MKRTSRFHFPVLGWEGVHGKEQIIGQSAPANQRIGKFATSCFASSRFGPAGDVWFCQTILQLNTLCYLRSKFTKSG